MKSGGASGLVEWGMATRRKPGETAIGDRAVVVACSAGLLVGAVDGLGHGTAAAAAANTAVSTIEQCVHESVDAIIQTCHEALQRTRGVVMSLALLHADADSVTWVGVGNVEALVLRGHSGQAPGTTALIAQRGIVGYQVPPLRPATLPLERGDTLVFATDGVDPAFQDGLRSLGPPDRIAERIVAAHAKPHDDALVLVVRYLGRDL